LSGIHPHYHPRELLGQAQGLAEVSRAKLRSTKRNIDNRFSFMLIRSSLGKIESYYIYGSVVVSFFKFLKGRFMFECIVVAEETRSYQDMGGQTV
jgi:hypothetical protein